MSVPTQAASDITVTTGATHEDAQLMLQLAALANTPLMEVGQRLLFGDDELTYARLTTEFGKGSEEFGGVMAVLRWHETLATLVKQGLLNRALVYDWLWLSGTWERCRDVALGQRAEYGEPAMWENFEALAAGQAAAG